MQPKQSYSGIIESGEMHISIEVRSVFFQLNFNFHLLKNLLIQAGSSTTVAEKKVFD